MLARIDAFRSTQVQAVSVSRLPQPLPHCGVHQSPGQPDQATGRMTGGGPVNAGADGSQSKTTPSGSPGTALGGPTVAGGTSAGSFGFGVISGGGRSDRVKRRGATARAYRVQRLNGATATRPCDG